MKVSTIKNKILVLLVFMATFIAGYSDDIKVGMECGYAPFNWFQNDAKRGAVKVDGGYCGGYDVEIAKVIAKKLNKKLVVVKTKWDALLGPALTSGKVDLVIAGMSATPERRQSLKFSKPYYESDLVVVVKKNGKYANAKTINDFAGAKITGQLNTLHYDVIDQMKGVQKQTAMESFPAMIVALNSGKIDGYISERPGAMAAQFSNPNLKFISFDKKDGFKYKHKIQENKTVQNVEKNVYFTYKFYENAHTYKYTDDKRKNYYFDENFKLNRVVDFGNNMQHIDISTVDENKIKEEIYENFKSILKEEEEKPFINLQWIFNWVYRDRIK